MTKLQPMYDELCANYLRAGTLAALIIANNGLISDISRTIWARLIDVRRAQITDLVLEQLFDKYIKIYNYELLSKESIRIPADKSVRYICINFDFGWNAYAVYIDDDGKNSHKCEIIVDKLLDEICDSNIGRVSGNRVYLC